MHVHGEGCHDGVWCSAWCSADIVLGVVLASEVLLTCISAALASENRGSCSWHPMPGLLAGLLAPDWMGIWPCHKYLCRCLSVACPGCSLAVDGLPWVLPGRRWPALGAPWPLMACPGCSLAIDGLPWVLLGRYYGCLGPLVIELAWWRAQSHLHPKSAPQI
jgi:hypothetical protein